MPLADRARRNSAIVATSFQIVRDSRKASQPRTIPDPHMICDPHPTANDYKIAQYDATGGPRLTGKYAMTPHHRVVPDLHQIINFGTFPDDGIAKRPAVHSRIGANLYAVLNDHPPEMRHLEMAIEARGIAEA
jgi:hypothetical protein